MISIEPVLCHHTCLLLMGNLFISKITLLSFKSCVTNRKVKILAFLHFYKIINIIVTRFQYQIQGLLISGITVRVVIEVTVQPQLFLCHKHQDIFNSYTVQVN